MIRLFRANLASTDHNFFLRMKILDKQIFTIYREIVHISIQTFTKSVAAQMCVSVKLDISRTMV